MEECVDWGWAMGIWAMGTSTRHYALGTGLWVMGHGPRATGY